MAQLADSGIQAAPGPMQGLAVVGCPTQVKWTPPHRFPIPHWCLQPKGFLHCEAGENPGISLGIAGLCQRVRGPNRHSLWVSKEYQSYMPPDGPQQWWHGWGSPSKTHRRGTWNTPTPEEEAVLLGKEIKWPPVPGSSPEPAEGGTTSSASSPPPTHQSNCYTYPKAMESWREIDADPNNPSRWVCFYLQENDRVPKWCREFQPLICSPHKSFTDVPVQIMGCQHAVPFRQPATQLEWGGSWTTLPCLGLLDWRDFPSPKRFQGSWGLSRGVGWSDNDIGQGSPKMCCLFWDASGGVLQSSAGTLWVPHIHVSEWQPGWHWNVRCGWKGPSDPTSVGWAPLLMSRLEPPLDVTALVSWLHQSQKRPHHQRNSLFCQGEDHLHLLAFPSCGLISLTHPH